MEAMMIAMMSGLVEQVTEMWAWGASEDNKEDTKEDAVLNLYQMSRLFSKILIMIANGEDIGLEYSDEIRQMCRSQLTTLQAYISEELENGRADTET